MSFICSIDNEALKKIENFKKAINKLKYLKVKKMLLKRIRKKQIRERSKGARLI